MGSRKATTADIITNGYYQPSILARLGLAVLLAFSAFAIPYSITSITVAAAVEASGVNVVPDVVPTEESAAEEEPLAEGELPKMLLFSSDEYIPATANMIIGKPTEEGWELVSWSPNAAEYEFKGCTITASIYEQEFLSTGKDASEEALTQAFPGVSPQDSTVVQITEIRYNVTSVAQYFGFGYQSGSSEYTKVYVRGFSTLGLTSYIAAYCPTQELMYEAGDSVRSQLGILISP
jgi:hypothetical protein